MSAMAPPAKRKFHSSLDSEPPLFVAYEDYLAMHKHVIVLTDIIQQIRDGLIEEGSTKLGKIIANTCQTTPDPPQLGPPVSALSEVFVDAVSTPAPSSSTKSFANAVLSSMTTSAERTSAPVDPSEIAKQAYQLLEKSTRAVIEGAPDDKSPNQDQKDSELIAAIANKHSLPIPSQVYRHVCSSRFRPLKLQFSSKSERDTFLKGFNKIKNDEPLLNTIEPKLRARRDLTRSELETLRAFRKFVYDENLKAKTTKSIMQDIHYKLNDKPRPFV
ncbi:hypothetical protein L3Y34_019538 [Caenorhabditis briggsae]|uniref:Uncharacterized protein n=1 Tax=Caenorhabditis briggsae TaxID=6238 RepID=A0AAE9IW81_CAEBR|nr:hypothetical protein L3Y34_019538 [Caenorhabditis briggsae]